VPVGKGGKKKVGKKKRKGVGEPMGGREMGLGIKILVGVGKKKTKTMKTHDFKKLRGEGGEQEGTRWQKLPSKRRRGKAKEGS